jgi:hypothetical protein
VEISREDTQVGLADKIGNLLVLCQWRSGDFTKKKSLLVNLITFLAYNSTCSRSANIVIYYYSLSLACALTNNLLPGIFRGNCPFGNFKGRYAGRIGRQDWKSLIFCPFREIPLSHPRVNPTTGEFLFSTSSYLKMASRNKLLPVWGSHLGNTRDC